MRSKKTLARFDPGLILVLLLLTFAISPLLRSGLPSMADVPIHLYRLAELDRCWRDGVYYPRWAPNLAFGYGYPIFNFAPPLPYFIAQWFHILGADLETAIKLLAVLCFLLYGLGMYLFAREVLDAKAALLAAAAYVYTPFRFREALIYGGNYPQILAMALYPWILWAFHQIIIHNKTRYIAAGALVYASLMLSHNFHALVFTPLLLTYVLYLVWITKGWARIREAGLAWGLGLGLSAFFWVPVLHDMQWTPTREDYYISHTDFRQRFLSFRDLLAWPAPLDAAADNPYLPFSLGPAIVVLAAISLATLTVDAGYQVWRKWIAPSQPPDHLITQPPDAKWHLLFFAFILAASIFMMLPASAPIWENAPFLPIGEHPWRLMGIANLASAFLAGASPYLWNIRRSGKEGLSLLHVSLSVVMVILASAVYLYPTRPFVEYDNPSLSEYFRYELNTQTMGTTVIGEYMPIWAKEIPTTSPLMPAYLAGQPVEKLNRQALPDPVQAQLLEHTVVSDRYRFRSDQPFTAHFHTFYFPAWKAYLDGQPTQIQLTDPFALIAVPVPTGEHELLLRFENLPLWTAMNALSVTSLLAVLVIWVLPLQKCGTAKSEGARSETCAHRSVFSHSQVLILGGILLLLFLAKVLVVDSHTTWFRRRSPVGQVVGVQHPARVNLEDRVLFLGYDLVSSDMMRQGGDLHVRLYWLALQPLDVNYSSFLHLDAPPDYATWATSDNVHPGDPQAVTVIPSSRWQTSTYVRDEHRLEVPPDIPPVQYLLRVGLYDRSTGRRLQVLADDGSILGDSVTLQPVRVTRAHTLSPRQLPHRVAYTLGRQIELLGYDLEVGGWKAGVGNFELALYWRARAVVGKDYTVFVHLVDQGGRLWGQGDGVPVGGLYPTSAWLPGQVIEDRHVIQVDPDVPPGSYRVLVGLYDPATLERLEAVGPEGPVPDGAIVLEPALVWEAGIKR